MENRITLRHLEAFRAIMVRRTVTGAAEMLGVTQPVVTRLIADLEERIAIALFTRSKGRLIPTPEAMLLVTDVEQSLVGIERIVNAASNIKSLNLGHIEIASAPNMALSLLPQAITSFTNQHPDVRVSMQMHSSSTVLEMIHHDRCDLGFAMLPMRSTKYGNSETILTARMVGVVPANHPLAVKTSLRPEDFAGERFISMLPMMEPRMRIDSIMMSHRVARRMGIETQTSAAVIQLVESGAGISIIDPLTASAYIGARLKFIPFEPSIVDSYSILISQRNSSTLILKPFVDQVRKEIRKIVPKHLVV